MTRPDIHTVMMTIAEVMSCRATCARRGVGAVITTHDNRILGTGYNGPAAGQTHCTDTPCGGAHYTSGERLDLCEAVHAEQNALVNVTDITRAHNIYVTTMPCVSCCKLLLNTPIKCIYYARTYGHAAATVALWTRDNSRVITHIHV